MTDLRTLETPHWSEGSRALRDVVAERVRQVREEGWTEQHDDQHSREELALAAAVYALPSQVRARPRPFDMVTLVDRIWPWDRSWFRPGDRRRDLVKAAALLVAEIERIDRLAGGSAAASPP